MGLKKFRFHGKTLSVFELACLRLLEKKIACCTPEHSKAFLYIINSGFYKSSQEISLALGLRSRKLEKILNALAQKRLIEQSGCLFKPKPIEELIAQI